MDKFFASLKANWWKFSLLFVAAFAVVMLLTGGFSGSLAYGFRAGAASAVCYFAGMIAQKWIAGSGD